jgi:hypothetical protein
MRPQRVVEERGRRKFMSRRFRLAMLAASVAAIMAIGPVAIAHPGLAAGEPNCLGQRNAHANDPHGHHDQMNPQERAALLQENVVFFHGISPPAFQEFLEDFFGADLQVSVGEKNKWTKAVCAGEVPFPEE